MMPLALINPELLFLCLSFFVSLGALLVFSIM
jgi:hypothetical protein